MRRPGRHRCSRQLRTSRKSSSRPWSSRARRPARRSSTGSAAIRSCGDASSGSSAHDAQASDFLEAPASTPTVTVAHDSRSGVEEPGTVIGPYKLLEQIGEGGMGVVYMAEQTAARPPQGGPEGHQAGHGHQAGRRPVRGRAAGPGDDGPPQHRQGPRRRRRPTSGRPYFVMELVRGIPITEYCDREQLSDPRAAGAVRRWSAGPCSTPTRRGSSTAT